MPTFRFPLWTRLLLAVTSGMLTYPAIRLDSLLGPGRYPPLFSWWLIIHGLLFGLLVMAPFISEKRLRGVHAAALAIASVLAYDAAIRVPDLIQARLFGDAGDFVVAGVCGALLVATAVRFLAPLAVTRAYWGLVTLAGLAGGLVFSCTFDLCNWDSCAKAWMILPYSGGWVAWQTLVLLAMYYGSDRRTAGAH